MSAALYSQQEIHLITSGAQSGLGPTAIVAHLAAHGFRRSVRGVEVKLRELGLVLPRTNGWTPEQDALLREGRAAGLTFSQIALRLAKAGRAGITRNAVIGRAGRLGLHHGPEERVAAEKREEAKARRAAKQQDAPAQRRVAQALGVSPARLPLPVAPAVPPPARLAPPAQDSRCCGLMGLTATTCRWPQGDPLDGGFRFCGARVRAGSPYCAAHHRMAYVPAPDRRVREAPDAARSRPALAAERELDCVEALAGGAA